MLKIAKKTKGKDMFAISKNSQLNFFFKNLNFIHGLTNQKIIWGNDKKIKKDQKKISLE